MPDALGAGNVTISRVEIVVYCVLVLLKLNLNTSFTACIQVGQPERYSVNSVVQLSPCSFRMDRVGS